VIKCSIWKKRKIKTKRKSYEDQGKGINRIFFNFGDQDTIEVVIILRIDNRTIKKGILWLSSLSSATR
jgi:hypothetical protein